MPLPENVLKNSFLNVNLKKNMHLATSSKTKHAFYFLNINKLNLVFVWSHSHFIFFLTG